MNLNTWICCFFAIILLQYNARASPCIRRKFDYDSVVCVCNATYCDFEPPQTPNMFEYYLYTSDKAGKRFDLTKGIFKLFGDDNDTQDKHKDTSNEFTVNLSKTFHHYGQPPSENLENKVQGFGGAFTDAAGANYFSLSPEARSNLIKSYFSARGINYNLCRLPIAGNDFSPRMYTYDDVPGDISLSYFNLTNEDYALKIPMIKEANETCGGTLQLIASAWSAPPWMKDNNAFKGKSMLSHEYYQTYVNYLIKFLEYYKEQGVDVWALTTGNEPINGLFGDFPETFQFNCMGWSPFGLGKWINNNLGPTLKASRFPDTKLYIIDDQKILLPWFIPYMTLSGTEWMDYVHGVAVHWYVDVTVNTPDVMRETRRRYPQFQIVNTEASQLVTVVDAKESSYGPVPRKCIVCLGLWRRAEEYAANIIDNMNNGLAGWIEFNLALNMTGGPLWHDVAPLDAPIIVNSTTDEFYKQPMFYAIGHFSKFIKRGARVVQGPTQWGVVDVLITLYEEREVVVVLLNRSEREVILRVRQPFKGVMQIQLSPRSISTLMYQK